MLLHPKIGHDHISSHSQFILERNPIILLTILTAYELTAKKKKFDMWTTIRRPMFSVWCFLTSWLIDWLTNYLKSGELRKLISSSFGHKFSAFYAARTVTAVLTRSCFSALRQVSKHTRPISNSSIYTLILTSGFTTQFYVYSSSPPCLTHTPLF